MTVRLGLLEGFELWCDGDRITLPMNSQKLLAFLALHNRPLLRLYVAGALWIDASEARSYANLRSALWRLRRTGYALVEASSSHLQLAPDVQVDVHRATESARAALARVQQGAAYAADQFAGDLLPDWYDDWVETERERIRQLRLHALESVATRLLDEGRFGEAVDAGLVAVGIEPLRESAHRILVKVYLAEGNWSEALRQYRVYARRLENELGLEPSALMQHLVRDIVA